MLEVWPAILVTGVTFAGTQLLVGAYKGPWLVDIAAATATLVAPHCLPALLEAKARAQCAGRRRIRQSRQRFEHGAGRTFSAWLPWLVLGLVVFAWGIPQFSQWVDQKTSIRIAVAGLHNVV